MTRSGDCAAKFRERAEELYSIADLVHCGRNREILLKCAADYEKMARQYEVAASQGGRLRLLRSALERFG